MGEQSPWTAAAGTAGAAFLAWAARKFLRARNVSESERIRLIEREIVAIKRDYRDMTQRMDIVSERLDSMESNNEETQREAVQHRRALRIEVSEIRRDLNAKLGELMERLAPE